MSAQVHYINFSKFVYYSITPENIAVAASCKLALTDLQLREIRELVDARERRVDAFDGNMVRFLLEEDGKVEILVDSAGGVWSRTGEYRIPSTQFAKLRSLVDSIALAQGKARNSECMREAGRTQTQ
jgi:hypothetical protein